MISKFYNSKFMDIISIFPIWYGSNGNCIGARQVQKWYDKDITGVVNRYCRIKVARKIWWSILIYPFQMRICVPVHLCKCMCISQKFFTLFCSRELKIMASWNTTASFTWWRQILWQYFLLFYLFSTACYAYTWNWDIPY